MPSIQQYFLPWVASTSDRHKKHKFSDKEQRARHSCDYVWGYLLTTLTRCLHWKLGGASLTWAKAYSIPQKARNCSLASSTRKGSVHVQKPALGQHISRVTKGGALRSPCWGWEASRQKGYLGRAALKQLPTMAVATEQEAAEGSTAMHLACITHPGTAQAVKNETLTLLTSCLHGS